MNNLRECLFTAVEKCPDSSEFTGCEKFSRRTLVKKRLGPCIQKQGIVRNFKNARKFMAYDHESDSETFLELVDQIVQFP